MEPQYVETNGIRLHVYQDGPTDGPLVILLHGFPEFWYGWRHQIPALAATGCRIWIPDQRGYNLSAKPDGITAYSLDELAADIIGLIDAAGREQAVIVGHDWGAGVAWRTAALYPERISKMVIMNVPHGDVMRAHLRRNFAQLLRSWYIFFFQLPRLPEALIRRNNWGFGTKILRNSSRPGTFSDHDLDQYRLAWSQPGAFRAMLNWYRAYVQHPPAPPAGNRIQVPTLMIWGAQDTALGREMAQPSIDLCDHGRLVFIEDASHWVHQEEPDRVNTLIKTFICEEK